MDEEKFNMFMQITDSLVQLEGVIQKLILRSEAELKYVQDNIEEYISNAVVLEKYQQSLRDRHKVKAGEEATNANR